jgi:HK97 gp10 family phage protein
MESEAINALDNAVSKSADIVLNASKSKVPKRTGALEKSSDKVKVNSRKNTSSFYNVVSKGAKKGGVRYGFAVELGTSKTKAKPFLRPAVDENKNKISETLNNEIVNSLNRIN